MTSVLEIVSFSKVVVAAVGAAILSILLTISTISSLIVSISDLSCLHRSVSVTRLESGGVHLAG